MRTILLLAAYAVFVNLAGLYLMFSDKRRARRHALRIPEATLFAVALIGGSIGTITGMFAFRHKTKHPAFLVGMPFLLLLQIIVLLVFAGTFETGFL